MKIEICANSYQSALNAQLAGADRIELCSELSIGGITPSMGMLQQVVQDINIVIHVLIRPRSGDFCYSKQEFEIMKKDIEICKSLGINGIVSGVLLNNHEIDINGTKELIEISKPLSFTFHRAFDCIKNPMEGLQALIDLKVDRVLTSGQKAKAIDGLPLLQLLLKHANNKIIILPGSGINSSTIEVFQASGFQEIHTSASTKVNNHLPFFDSSVQTVSDLNKIKELVKHVRHA